MYCFLQVRLGLRTHLTALRPVEVVLPRGRLTDTTTRLLHTALRKPQMNQLTCAEHLRAHDALQVETTEQLHVSNIDCLYIAWSVRLQSLTWQ